MQSGYSFPNCFEEDKVIGIIGSMYTLVLKTCSNDANQEYKNSDILFFLVLLHYFEMRPQVFYQFWISVKLIWGQIRILLVADLNHLVVSVYPDSNKRSFV